MSKKTGNPKGRPKGASKVTRGSKGGVIGRPKGEAGIMKEYRERMLASPKSAKVLESVFNAALDDDHKHQAAAWKLVLDRIAPISGFEKDAGGSGRGAIQVNITGVPGVQISSPEPSEEPLEPLEGQCETIEDE